MRTTIAMVLCSVSSLALGGAAYAQTAPAGQTASPTSTVTEIIVTARRRDEALQDVPQVVDVVTAETVNKLNIRNFNEVQSIVPGLQLKNESNGIGGGGQLRGIQYDINVSPNPTVAFYQNDAPLQALVVLQSIYDIGQVEVLRGPQGTLRGQATPSGSITITTKKPDLYRPGGNISVTASDTGGRNVNGGFGIPIINGIAALRVAGSIEDNEGNRVHTIQTGPGSDTRGPNNHTESGRVSLLVTPADFLRLEGVYQRMNSRSRSFDQYASFSLFNPAAAPSPSLIDPGDRQSIEETPRAFSQKFEVYNWRAELSHLGQRLIYQGEHYTLDVNGRTNADQANFIPGRDSYQRTPTSSKFTSHELRLQNEERLFDMFDYVIGGFRSRLESHVTNLQDTPVFLPAAFGGGLATIVTTPIVIKPVPLYETSFFGNLTAHIGQSTELSGGVRHIDQKSDDGSLTIAGSTVIPTPGYNDKGWVYAASIKHNFGDDLMVYANTGTSRRVGPNVIGDFSVAPSALEKSFTNLPAETSRNYELGLKSSFFDKRLRLNVTGYHQTFKNFPYKGSDNIYYVNYGATVTGGVVTITPGVAVLSYAAPVPVEVNGVELETAYNVTPNWNLGLLASYSLGKIKGGVVPCNDLNSDGKPDALTGPPTLAALQARVGANNLSTCKVTQRSAFQAPFSATAQTEFHMPLNDNVEGYVRGLFTFLGDSQGDPTFNYDQVKSYGLLNVFLGARSPARGWELSLFAKNLLNVEKATTVGSPAQTNYQRLTLPTFTTVAATATSTYSIINSTPPREFGINLRYAFGAR
ncbi:TonB-dependent receptor [Caulobacter sp. LARHSG274]